MPGILKTKYLNILSGWLPSDTLPQSGIVFLGSRWGFFCHWQIFSKEPWGEKLPILAGSLGVYIIFLLWKSVARTLSIKQRLKCKPKHFPNPFGHVNKHGIRKSFLWPIGWNALDITAPSWDSKIPVVYQKLRKLKLYKPLNSAFLKLIWAF